MIIIILMASNRKGETKRAGLSRDTSAAATLTAETDLNESIGTARPAAPKSRQGQHCDRAAMIGGFKHGVARLRRIISKP
jgi:hypothetical protein